MFKDLGKDTVQTGGKKIACDTVNCSEKQKNALSPPCDVRARSPETLLQNTDFDCNNDGENEHFCLLIFIANIIYNI